MTVRAFTFIPGDLLSVAKRYRVDVEKLQKAVAAEFAAKRDKKKAKPKAEAAA